MAAPESDKDGKRRYGQWAGAPNGYEEDTARCIEEVSDANGYLFRQCARKRGHGPGCLFCKQHGKVAAAMAARRREGSNSATEGSN